MNVERCPSCAAALRPGAEWCGLCFAPVGAEPEPQRTPSMLAAAHEPPPVGAIPPQGSAPPPPGTVAVAPTPPARAVHGWPCTACGALNDFTVSACSGCGAAFLATTRPGLTLPVIGDISRLSAPQRMLLALAASPLLAVVLVILAALVGTVF